MKKFWIWAAIGMLAVIGLANSHSDTNTTSVTTSSGDDTSAPACTRFRTVTKDVDEGILTDSELREKLRQVDDDASNASTDVKTASRHLFAASTRQDSAAFLAAVTEMGGACRLAGS